MPNPSAGRPKDLPREIILMVLAILDSKASMRHPSQGDPGRHRKEYRHFLSQASLVCYKWYLTLCPHIFAHLRLTSPAEIRFLVEMSRKKTGALTKVTYLELIDNGLGRIDLERSCKLLAGKLPALEVLSYNTLHALPHNLSPSSQHNDTLQALSMSPSRTSALSQFSTVHVLSLLGIKLPSFSTLARALGELHRLEQVALHHVAWVHKESCRRSPSRRLMRSFTRLRYVLADDVIAWPIMLLWAPMLERRRIIPDGPVTDNTDTVLLASLVNTCCERGSTAPSRMTFRYEGDIIHISVYKALDTPWALRIELWPSQERRSAIRRVELQIMDMESFVAAPQAASPDVADWKEIDLLFARQATALEYFSVSSDNEVLLMELLEQFPGLCGQNKFSIKVAKWNTQPIRSISAT